MVSPTDRQRAKASALGTLVVAAVIVAGVAAWSVGRHRAGDLANLVGVLTVCAILSVREWRRRDDGEWARSRGADEAIVAVLAAMACSPFYPETGFGWCGNLAVTAALAGLVGVAAASRGTGDTDTAERESAAHRVGRRCGVAPLLGEEP